MEQANSTDLSGLAGGGAMGPIGANAPSPPSLSLDAVAATNGVAFGVPVSIGPIWTGLPGEGMMGNNQTPISPLSALSGVFPATGGAQSLQMQANQSFPMPARSAPPVNTMQQSRSSPRNLPFWVRNVDSDRLLLFLIIDYLKRRGMFVSVQSLLAEARIDPMAPDTAETVQLMELLNVSWGRNPQPSTTMPPDGAGFLREWWGTFWASYQGKLSSTTTRPGPNGNIGSINVTANNSTVPSSSPPILPSSPVLMSRRSMLAMAMQSVGLAGRDHQTLNPEEQRMVSTVLQHLQQMQLQSIQQQKIAPSTVPSGTLPISSNFGMKSPNPSSINGSGTATSPTMASAATNTNVNSTGGTPNTRKRASNTPGGNASSPGVEVTATTMGILPSLTPQQMLQLRALQMQQHQQQLQQWQQLQQLQQLQTLSASSTPINTATTITAPTPFVSNASRLIVPGAGTNAGPAMVAANIRSNLTNANNVGSNSNINGMTRNPLHSNSQPSLGSTGSSSLSSSASSPVPTHTTTAATTGPDEGLMANINESALLSFFGNPQEWFALDGTANVEESFLDINEGGGEAETEEDPSIKRKAIEDVESTPDPNELLLMSEDGETPPPTLKSTLSGLTLIASGVLGQHEGGFKALSASFSRDGRILASGGHDKKIHLFDVKKMERLVCLEGHHTQQVTQVRFSPVGSFLACSSFDKTITLWDLRQTLDGEYLLPESIPETPCVTLRGIHDEPIWSLDFVQTNYQKDNSVPILLLVSIDSSGKMAIWDVEQMELLYQCHIPAQEGQAITIRHVRARPFADARPPLLAITDGVLVQFFDCHQQDFVGSIRVSTTTDAKPVMALNWDADRPNLLITATNDTVSVWDTSGLFPDADGGSLPNKNGVEGPRLIASHHAPADKITCCSLLAETTSQVPLAIFGGYQSIYLWEYSEIANADEASSTNNNSPMTSHHHHHHQNEHRSRVTKFPGAHEGLIVSLPVARKNIINERRSLIASASHDGWIKLWDVGKVDLMEDATNQSNDSIVGPQ